jgi:hypothetical protein
LVKKTFDFRQVQESSGAAEQRTTREAELRNCLDVEHYAKHTQHNTTQHNTTQHTHTHTHTHLISSLIQCSRTVRDALTALENTRKHIVMLQLLKPTSQSTKNQKQQQQHLKNLCKDSKTDCDSRGRRRSQAPPCAPRPPNDRETSLRRFHSRPATTTFFERIEYTVVVFGNR